MNKLRAAGAAAFMLLLVSACGGGGDDGPGPQPGPSQALQLSTTQLTLSSSSTAGVRPTATLSGSVTGNPSAVYATVTVQSTNGIDTVTAPVVSGASASITVFGKYPQPLGHGVYTDTIIVRACRDAACSSEYSGSPATVTVTYRVGLVMTPTSISRDVVEGAAVAGQGVDLSYQAGSGSWTAAVNYTSGAGWLTVPASGNTFPATVNASFGAMPAGTYTAQLEMGARDVNGSQPELRSIPVTYTVRPLLQAPAVNEFSVTTAQGAGGQSRSFAVGTNDAARNTAWTATVLAGAPWLQLTTSSGTTVGASTLAAALVPSEVAKLPNGRYVATVRIDPADPSASNVDVPVTLLLDRSFIHTVAPYVAGANRTAEVYLRGTLLGAGAITEVRFGSAPAVAFQRDSASRLRATHPALPAGRYPVSVSISGVPIDSIAELVVQDPGNYRAAGTAIVQGQAGSPLPYFAERFEFDPERRACYLATSQQPGVLIRVRADSASWNTLVSPVNFSQASISGLTLSADGKTLFVNTGGYVLHLDPVTLTETRRAPLNPPGLVGALPGGLQRLDDGTLAFVNANGGLSIYRPWDDGIVEVPLASSITGMLRANRTGSKLLVPVVQTGGIAGMDVYDSMTRGIATGLRPYVRQWPASDRFGDRWAVYPQNINEADLLIVSEDGTELGRTPTQRQDMARLWSADGRKVIAQDQDVNTGTAIYRAFDVSALPTITAGSTTQTVFEEGERYLTPTEDEIVTCGHWQLSAASAP